MDVFESVIDVSEKYDTLFVDVYGVLFDGLNLYEGVAETLKELKRRGKKIVIVSNTTQLMKEAIIGYAERGLLENIHYDYFITSGEGLHSSLITNKPFFEEILGHSFEKVKCLFMGNPNMFSDTDIVKTDSYEQADFVYVAPPRASYGAVRVDCLHDEEGSPVRISEFMYCDWLKLSDDKGRKGLAEFYLCLEELASLNKILLHGNPDIFAIGGVDGGRYPILTQGGIGMYYTHYFKGKVINFGKPFPEIFDFAKKVSQSENDKILMIGDTMWTDVLGAYNANIDSAMVLTGVTSQIIEELSFETLDEKLDALVSLGNKICGIENHLPTYVVKHFWK